MFCPGSSCSSRVWRPVAFPGRISFQWREAFSGALDLLKAYEALYLIVTCSKLLRRNRKNRTLLGAAIFFAVSLVFDRLLPLYEPVYSGCSLSWGAGGGRWTERRTLG